ncbi:hypothetical protein L873DRAFT_1790827 [Choiromyces venosus 120613-1]|uniref:Uncharacterized protein n=1 Tax=Choiromyces venosus 120613-1 TaxID=1336337 RepID=A0A3N4JVD5_9PEZI|nr:hypothetical protein L873DRAFT_1790827 [Choiromyces venosus 120613-1]
MVESLATCKKALEALKQIADVLCQSHPHQMSIIDDAAGDIVEGYSLSIECGEDNIIWTVKMGENCRFTSLMRSRTEIRPDDNPTQSSRDIFQIEKVWRGQVCHEILTLQSLGKLDKEWWKYPVTCSNDQNVRESEHYNYGPCKLELQNRAEAFARGQILAGVIYVTCSPITAGLSSEFSDSENKKVKEKENVDKGKGHNTNKDANDPSGPVELEETIPIKEPWLIQL